MLHEYLTPGDELTYLDVYVRCPFDISGGVVHISTVKCYNYCIRLSFPANNEQNVKWLLCLKYRTSIILRIPGDFKVFITGDKALFDPQNMTCIFLINSQLQ